MIIHLEKTKIKLYIFLNRRCFHSIYFISQMISGLYTSNCRCVLGILVWYRRCFLVILLSIVGVFL